MPTERDKYLISTLPETEYGQALERWLREEISLLENKEECGLKISNDPLHEDFRVQLGIKIGLKRVLKKPKECINELNKGDLKK